MHSHPGSYEFLFKVTVVHNQMMVSFAWLRDELRELTNSRDAWANHTTLQTSTIQKLQAENGQLQAGICNSLIHSLDAIESNSNFL